MTSVFAAICFKCKHRILEKGHPKCQAFPNNIPEDILGGDFLHVKPYPGDQGIQFEPVSGFSGDRRLPNKFRKKVSAGT